MISFSNYKFSLKNRDDKKKNRPELKRMSNEEGNE